MPWPGPPIAHASLLRATIEQCRCGRFPKQALHHPSPMCYHYNMLNGNEEPAKERTMKFDLDEEQSDIRDMVRRFTEHEITPYAGEWDETKHFPREIYHKMAGLGLMGMTTPEEYGGSALSRLSGALVYEELAKGEMATAVGLSVHNMVVGSIARFGNPEQRRRWVSSLASGELLGAFSLSEAASGSDAASPQCRAEYRDGDYVLNGTKLWVTNGGEAEIYLLMARTSGNKGSAGISCFVVEKD